MGKILESIAVKINTDLEPLILVETEVVEESEPEPKVVEDSELESEVKEPITETLVDFPVEPTMKLLLFSPHMRLFLSMRSPDVYDSFQIFLQEIGALVCGLVGAGLPYYAARNRATIDCI